MNIMNDICMASDCEVALVDTNVPKDRATNKYGMESRNSETRLPSIGTLKTYRIASSIITSSAIARTMYGEIFPSSMPKGFTGVTNSCSSVPLSFSRTTENAVRKQVI